MASNANYFLNKTLGSDFMESLEKFELWKPGTKTVIDHEEIKTALKIVPKTLMSFLISHLSNMEIGDNKEIELPIAPNSRLQITKHERDVFSGDVIEDNKVLVNFKYRSIPGVGLIILSAFELYDIDELSHEHEEKHEDIEAKVNKLIEERLVLHDLINKVVDKKIMEKDAIGQLMLAKLSETINRPAPVELAKEPVVELPKKKSLPLKEFLDNKDKKRKEFEIHMAKGETVSCPDCHKNIFDGSVFAGCICFGEDRDNKVYIKKSENGVKIRFGKSWDAENIEMLLEILRRKHG